MREFLKEINRIQALVRCWQDVTDGWSKWGNRVSVKREQAAWLILWWIKGGVLFALIQ